MLVRHNLPEKFEMLLVTHFNIKGKMIKDMLKGRKKSDTHLATIRRHRWSAQVTMKKDNKLELSASLPVQLMKATVLLKAPIYLVSSSSVHSSDVYE